MAHTVVHGRPGVAPVGKLFQSLRHILLGVQPDSNGTAPALRVRVRCTRCGEVIAVRVDKANDLECEFAEEEGPSEVPRHPTGYTLRKELVGRGCQNLVHFEMGFDDHRRVTGHRIEGGEFVGWEDMQ